MILVTGTILASAETLDQLLKLSLEHVHRSRTEPGCLAHAVHQDAENPLRLVFVEEWADQAALFAHFALPASREFAKAAQKLATAPNTLQVYEATAIQLGGS